MHIATKPIEPETFWQNFHLQQSKGLYGQATLLLAAQHLNLDTLILRMARVILCLGPAEKAPCGFCKSCQLDEHPDIHCITPEKMGSSIRIEQIRELQPFLYRSAQISRKKVVLISPCDKMNIASSNALLKMLEEPPEDAYFILAAEQISTIPLTIVSRCQQWQFTEIPTSCSLSTLNLAKPQDVGVMRSDKEKLINEQEDIVKDLLALQHGFLSAPTLAEKWSKYNLSALLCFLYLLNANLININMLEYVDTSSQPTSDGLPTPGDLPISPGCLLPTSPGLSGGSTKNIVSYSELLDPPDKPGDVGNDNDQPRYTGSQYSLAKSYSSLQLFDQLEKINAASRIVNQSIAVNTLLTLEEILIGYEVTSCL
jgi:DNA polymerase-3 subunit delta'